MIPPTLQKGADGAMAARLGKQLTKALAPHWGVDSGTPVQTKVARKGKKPISLFDYVVDTLGRVPAFWGRYVGGPAWSRLTKAEADYIFAKSNGATRILLVYNGTSPSSVAGGRQAGIRDAKAAIAGADLLEIGFPDSMNVMIYGDIEGSWSPSVEWFLGWWETMRPSPYAGMGGIYCRAILKSFYDNYFEALKRTTPEAEVHYLYDPFAKKHPRIDDSAWIPPDTHQRVRYLWSTWPRKDEWSNPASDPLLFAPDEPSPLTGHVALWQYHLDFLRQKGPRTGLIDMDLADDRAYDLMWQGTPSPLVNPFLDD
jgi:hypothetical protein